MNATVVTTIIILILLYIVYRYLTNEVVLTVLKSAKEEQRIDDLPVPYDGLLENATYSLWIYVEDWNSDYGQKKILFQRDGTSTTTASSNPAFQVFINPWDNNLVLQASNIRTSLTDQSSTSCTAQNIPLQQWVNIVVAFSAKSADMYVNGKLVTTCLIDNSNHSNEGTVYISPKGKGFYGWNSKFQFWPSYQSPFQIWKNYSQGYSSNMGFDYNVILSLINNGQQSSSVSLMGK